MQSATAASAIGELMNNIRVRRATIDANQRRINIEIGVFTPNIGISDQLQQLFFDSPKSAIGVSL